MVKGVVNLVKITNFPEVEGVVKGVVNPWSTDHPLTTPLTRGLTTPISNERTP